MRYNAFISYSHAADGKLAPALQKSLHRFAKPLFSLRALRIFRDKTSLAVTPALWDSIAEAMDSAEYFILLASSESAQSHWVLKEVKYWLKHKSSSKILIVVTEGKVLWDEHKNDFDWSVSNALPRILEKAFSQEPLFIDLTWVESHEHLSLRDSDFRPAIAQLAATLHNRPLDEISGEDVKQHRRFVRLVIFGIAMLSILTVTSIFAAYIADKNRKEAVRQRFVSTSQALAAYSEREQKQSHRDERAALLARQAYEFNERYQGNRLDQIDKGLRNVLSKPYFSAELSQAKSTTKISGFALSHDGRYLAAGGEGQHIYLWDLKKRPYEANKLVADSNLIWTLAFGHRSNTLVAGTHDGRIRVWYIEQSGKAHNKFTIETGLNQRIDNFSISSDDRWLAVACKDGIIRVWSLVQPEKMPIELCCHNNAVTVVLFHPIDPEILASGGADKSVYLWDLRRQDKPVRDYTGHDHTIQSLAFSHDGQWLAAGTEFSLVAGSIKKMFEQKSEEFEYNRVGGTIWIRNTGERDAAPQILKSGDAISIRTLDFSPDSALIAANGENYDVVLWEWAQANTPSRRLSGHRSHVRMLRYNDAGNLLVSLDDESAIRLWDLHKPVAQPDILESHTNAVTGVEFDHTSHWLVSIGGWEGSAYLWDLTSMQAQKIEVEKAGDFSTLALHPKQALLAIGSGSNLLDVDNTVRLWKIPNINRPDNILKGFTSELTALAISKNGTWLAAAARYDKKVLLWKFNELNDPPLAVPTEHDVTALEFAQDGVLLIATSDKKVRLLSDVGSQSTHLLIEDQESRLNTLAYEPNQQLLATGSEDGTFRLWQITAFDRPAILRWSLKYQKIYSVAFSPEGKEVAAAGKDGKVRIWNLERENADAQLFDGPGKNVYSVAFSPDGNWIAAGGSDKTVKLWPRTKWLAEIVCQQVSRNLTQKEWAEYVGADIDYEKTCDRLPAGN